MAKSAAFGVMHLGIAFGVSLALTGSWQIAGAITVVEPIVNTVAHYFFDRWWNGRHPHAAKDIPVQGREAFRARQNHPIGEAAASEAIGTV